MRGYRFESQTESNERWSGPRDDYERDEHMSFFYKKSVVKVKQKRFSSPKAQSVVKEEAKDV